MRVAVMAAGAVGGYFGGRLAAAGHDVAFIARGAHRDAIRRDGLKIESALGDLHLKDVNVTDDPKRVGPVDVVLFAVKLWDTETAGEQTRPLVGSNTRLITLQNGVDSVERIVPILGDNAIIGGTTYVVTTIARPGVVRHTGTVARIRCGRLDRRPDPVLTGYVEQIKNANIDSARPNHSTSNIAACRRSDRIILTMSAFGTKRRFQSRSAMSAFGGKADIALARLNVHPNANIGNAPNDV
jgi:2-dehydropantoate 2-reductase